MVSVRSIAMVMLGPILFFSFWGREYSGKSDNPLHQHGIRNLAEGRDVRPFHIIDAVFGTAVLHTFGMDLLHDVLQANIHLLPGPLSVHAVLAHLQTGYG